MPIYGYACTNCGHTLDALQKIADDPLVQCPVCDEAQLKRQLSAPRFRLKGQGWYETDFKSDNQRNLAGEKEAKESDDKADTKKSVDKKSDDSKSADKKTDTTKSATKSEKKTEKKTSNSKASSA
ncbi:MAG: zinc ribbon domain-containing protein [Gammaproteobacteria bacterium]|nr:zinc ribbon domain-containing protein [Gammaproteobacteria bacterium]